MIKATGSVRALHLSIDGAPITVLDHIKREFTAAGQTYTIRRKGAFAPLHELWHDSELLASAQQALFVNRYTVTSAGRTWTLKAEELLAKRFGLFDGDTRVGGIAPANRFHFTSDITIDLPDTLSLPAQIFLVWVLLWKWGDTAG